MVNGDGDGDGVFAAGWFIRHSTAVMAGVCAAIAGMVINQCVIASGFTVLKVHHNLISRARMHQCWL